MPAGCVPVTAADALMMAKNHGCGCYKPDANNNPVLDQALVDARALDVARVEAIKLIKARRNLDIANKNGIDVGDMGMLVVVFLNTDPSFHTATMTASKAIWDYAASKITQAQTATLAQIEAYDPNTDPNWPT